MNGGSPRMRGERPFDRRLGWSVWAIAGLHLGALLVLANRYGFHRDELYFLEAGRHLALGYVDQPPLVALLARAQVAIFGDPVAAIRVVPAITSAGSVVLAAVLARELGGTRRSMAIAAGAIGGAGFVLATGHLLSTATFDLFFWLAGLAVTARMLRTNDPRWWLAFGAIAGVALWNKQLIVLLAVALVIGLAIERRWDLLATRWIAAGALVALVIAAPPLWWQAVNGWPQLEMAGALSDRLGTENRITLLPLQLVLLGPFLVPVAIAGIRWLGGRRAGGRLFRPLLWAYAAALVLTFMTGGRPYYPLALAAVVVVAGTISIDPTTRRRFAGLVAVNALVSVPLALPVLPPDVLADTPIGEINDTQVEQIGWQGLADEVAEVVGSLPEDEGDDAVLLTGTYGEAGALDRYGPERGLPEVYSGHNSYWHWRRPTDDEATVVSVRLPAAFLRSHFGDCRPAGTVDNAADIENEAYGQPIHVCRDLRGTWSEAWPAFRHYN